MSADVEARVDAIWAATATTNTAAKSEVPSR